MADALDKIRAGVDKARTKLAAHRLGGRLFDVTVETFVPGDPILGTAGTWGAAVTIEPRPSTSLKAVYRPREGGLAIVGDAEVSGISRNTPEAVLRSPGGHPTRWTIDGQRYSLVDLISEPLQWRAILKREEG